MRRHVRAVTRGMSILAAVLALVATVAPAPVQSHPVARQIIDKYN